MAHQGKTAVLLLAHGSPDSVEQVPEFLLRVTGGRPLPPPVVEEVQASVCSDWPLSAHRTDPETRRTSGSRIGHTRVCRYAELEAVHRRCSTHHGLGWHRRHAVAICLAPQNSRTSVGLYRADLASNGTPFTIDFVESWHDQPLLIRAFAEKLRTGWDRACHEMGTQKVPIIFTAHSVPERTIAEGDPYEGQAKETASLVASEAALSSRRLDVCISEPRHVRRGVARPESKTRFSGLKEKGHRGVFHSARRISL